jgi:hypothetical protein
MQIHWGLQFYVLTYVATFVLLVLSSSYYQRLWRAGAPHCARQCFRPPSEEPSRGADVAGVRPVPVQMWKSG